VNDQSQGEPGAGGGGLMTRWVELIVALLIVLGGAITVKDSVRLGAQWASDGPEAGYFPFLVGITLLLSGGWIVATTLATWRKQAGDVFVGWGPLRPVLTMLLPTIVYIVLISFLGLYVASAIFIGGFMIWQGKYRLLPAAGVSLGMPIVLFLLFEVWFLVPLPKGPVERLLGY
jgi:putative tricarboxylic transport membrane protein